MGTLISFLQTELAKLALSSESQVTMWYHATYNSTFWTYMYVVWMHARCSMRADLSPIKMEMMKEDDNDDAIDDGDIDRSIERSRSEQI